MIAIDFETANEQRASACSVGLAFVEDGRVVRVEERMIRPREMRFSAFNIAVHGIRPDDVEEASEFPDVMDEFAEDFAGAVMIAHNAGFDFSVWRAGLAAYGQPYPDVSYFCSVKLAQRVWPQLHSHRLNVLAAHLGLRFRHHRASDDAVVCAEAVLAMLRERHMPDVTALGLEFGLSAGRLDPDAKASPGRRRPSSGLSRGV